MDELAIAQLYSVIL